MKMLGPLLVVSDLDYSRAFYERLFEQSVVLDFGANISFNGGFSLQSQSSWQKFIQKEAVDIKYGGNDFELYFEVEDFDRIYQKLLTENVELVHASVEYPWGQRVVRVYDPDRHIIEVGEDMQMVIKRFLRAGMTIEQVAEISQHPLNLVEALAKEI